MKKSLFFLVALMFSINASAQFFVENSGKAGVGVTYNSSNNLNSQFSIWRLWAYRFICDNDRA